MSAVLSKIELPSMDLNLPSTSADNAADLPMDVVVPAVAVLGLLAVVASLANAGGGDGGDESGATQTKKRKKTSKLSIPYDAPARLAYEEYLQSYADANGKAPKFKEDAFATFEELYEAQAVAEATAKHYQRLLEQFDNEPLDLVVSPPRPEKPPSNKEKSSIGKTDPYFFAAGEEN